jgi:NitT/TauT family transport system ATP-binding protein
MKISMNDRQDQRREAGPPVAGAPLVSVRDLCLSYPGKGPGELVHVLKGIELEVRAGEFVCIVGPSGCGKTTLLNILGGFLAPTRGSVVIEGEQVHRPDSRRIYIFQEGGVFPWLTVHDNIGFGLDKRRGGERDATIRHYEEMVGLSGFERSYPRELSGGMRQRVEIARALAADPELLFMDEPFGALDYITRYKMRADLVRIWQAEQKTILFVTHDIDEALQLADRVVILSQRPAQVASIVTIDLPRPRDLDSPDYLEKRHQIFATMGMTRRGEVISDVIAPEVNHRPPAGSSAARDAEPFPEHSS